MTPARPKDISGAHAWLLREWSDHFRAALEAKGIVVNSAEVTMLPNSTVKVQGSDAQSVLQLLEALEEHEDVQNVYANFDIPEEEIEKIV